MMSYCDKDVVFFNRDAFLDDATAQVFADALKPPASAPAAKKAAPAPAPSTAVVPKVGPEVNYNCNVPRVRRGVRLEKPAFL